MVCLKSAEGDRGESGGESEGEQRNQKQKQNSNQILHSLRRWYVVVGKTYIVQLVLDSLRFGPSSQPR